MSGRWSGGIFENRAMQSWRSCNEWGHWLYKKTSYGRRANDQGLSTLEVQQRLVTCKIAIGLEGPT